MISVTRVVPLRQPNEVDDPLTAVLRSGIGSSSTGRTRRLPTGVSNEERVPSVASGSHPPRRLRRRTRGVLRRPGIPRLWRPRLPRLRRLLRWRLRLRPLLVSSALQPTSSHLLPTRTADASTPSTAGRLQTWPTTGSATRATADRLPTRTADGSTPSTAGRLQTWPATRATAGSATATTSFVTCVGPGRAAAMANPLAQRFERAS